jgi:hypothetical protein
MKGLALWSLATVLLLSAGCAARPDWIEATLVTTDVTGVWRGKAGQPGQAITLVLEQRGPKVTGRMEARGNTGALQGSVEGDMFRFAATFGALRGEATVAGDEMTGEVSGGGDYFGSRSRLFLRRGESSVPDTQQER